MCLKAFNWCYFLNIDTIHYWRSRRQKKHSCAVSSSSSLVAYWVSTYQDMHGYLPHLLLTLCATIHAINWSSGVQVCRWMLGYARNCKQSFIPFSHSSSVLNLDGWTLTGLAFTIWNGQMSQCPFVLWNVN